MWKSIVFVTAIWGLMLFDSIKARPQGMENLQAGAAMAFAAVKGAIDNGAAAKDKKEFEFFGVKAKNDMAVGFGDAMNDKRSTSDSSSSESDESDRRKRSASFEIFTNDIMDKYNKNAVSLRIKRSVVNESSFTSSELEDLKRHKRSGSFESLGNETVISCSTPNTNSTSSESLE